jgi:hypothetical protein
MSGAFAFVPPEVEGLGVSANSARWTLHVLRVTYRDGQSIACVVAVLALGTIADSHDPPKVPSFVTPFAPAARPAFARRLRPGPRRRRNTEMLRLR